MPEGEGDLGDVDAAAMGVTTSTASPFSRHKSWDTSRLRLPQFLVGQADLCGASLANNLENDAACVIALVGQDGLQLTIAGSQHRLSHLGLREFQRLHIARHNRSAMRYQCAAEFMQCALAKAGNLGVTGPYAGFLTCSLAHSHGLPQARI